MGYSIPRRTQAFLFLSKHLFFCDRIESNLIVIKQSGWMVQKTALFVFITEKMTLPISKNLFITFCVSQRKKYFHGDCFYSMF